ncbi:DNA polymerase III subunit alpha, partial [bacterium]|nr:DNA polymerase III subunit alpha [candidate division CSSED10-310 bacterium]
GKQSYLRRHLGLEPVHYLHPLLEPIMNDTYGCLIYQEQVIQVAAAVAGMTLAEADGLRRCMSKKRNWNHMSTYRERFFSGAGKNGISEPVIKEIFRQIESFAGYAFCKAHSASFAVESFESMYWKSHHPAEFMAAVLSNQGGYYSQLEYLEEARRLGVSILPPCVVHGEERFHGRNMELRVGLAQIRHMHRETLDRLLAERKREPFASLLDFLSRVEPDERELLGMAMAGALDCFGLTRPQLLWVVRLLYDKGSMRLGRLQAMINDIPKLPEFSEEDRIGRELEALDLCVSGHPLRMYPDKLAWLRKRRRIVPAAELAGFAPHDVYCIGWRVTGKITRTGTDNKLMEFMTFSDESGRFEAVFFPESFQRNAAELRRGRGPFLIKGRVQMEFGAENLMASDVKLL